MKYVTFYKGFSLYSRSKNGPFLTMGLAGTRVFESFWAAREFIKRYRNIKRTRDCVSFPTDKEIL